MSVSLADSVSNNSDSWMFSDMYSIGNCLCPEVSTLLSQPCSDYMDVSSHCFSVKEQMTLCVMIMMITLPHYKLGLHLHIKHIDSGAVFCG